MILGTDQGTTISLNYGKTWSSWYNQPTAQFYHVITDNEFPYHVYGAQQDSGAAAVASRTDHGQITARDWFLVGGGESGWLAPDPSDPNILYATGHVWQRGALGPPHLVQPGHHALAPAELDSEINERKYRDPWTPMLVFSPLEKNTLYLGTQYVMKTTDGGLHWETDQSRSHRARCPTPRAKSPPAQPPCRTRRSAASAWCSALRLRR